MACRYCEMRLSSYRDSCHLDGRQRHAAHVPYDREVSLPSNWEAQEAIIGRATLIELALFTSATVTAFALAAQARAFVAAFASPALSR